MNKRKTILHIITTLTTGGTENTLLKYIDNSPEELSHHVLCLSGKGHIAEKLIQNGTTVTFLELEYKINLFKSLYQIPKLYYSLKPKFINAWMYHAYVLSVFLYFLPFNHASLIWNIRNTNTSFKLNPRITTFCAHLSAHFSFLCDHIIYNSKCSQSAHKQLGYKTKSVKVIPNGVDCDLYRMQDPLNLWKRRNPNEIVIGYISRYNTQKDPDTFLKTVYEFTKKNKNAVFLCFGLGFNEENSLWLQKINDLKINDYVFSFGSDHNLSQWFAEFDFTTLSSESESFPNVVIESMACGKPVVATNVGDIAIIIEDCGIVVNSKSAIELAAGWESMVQQLKLDPAKLSDNCRKRVKEQYELSAINTKYWQCFN